jgi:hypothetical protein
MLQNTKFLLIFLLAIGASSCESSGWIRGGGEGYSGTALARPRFHYIERARNYTLDLADRIRGLANPEIPGIVAEAEKAARDLNGAMATFNDTPDAHYRVEQALAAAGRVSRRAYDIAESYGLNPPNPAYIPYFSQTFTDVHGSP